MSTIPVILHEPFTLDRSEGMFKTICRICEKQKVRKKKKMRGNEKSWIYKRTKLVIEQMFGMMLIKSK